MNMKNKNLLITGGTSGLGKSLVKHALAQGARVAVIARRQKLLDTLKSEFPTVIALQGDVSDKAQIYPLAGAVVSQLGPVDGLFNVASTLGHTPLRTLMDSDCEDLEKTFETNVLGPFRLTKALIPDMLLRKKGVVVNISSDAAVSAYAQWGAYSMSKAALDHMTRIFAEELKNSGVHFMSVDPGDMNTPMHFAAIPEADPADLKDSDMAAQQLLQHIAAFKPGEPVRSAL